MRYIYFLQGWLLSVFGLSETLCHSVSLLCRKSISKLDPCQVNPEEKVSLHQTPDAGVGEGVSLQHVPDQGPTPGGGRTLKSDRETGQNLVPEQTDEDEEADDPGEEECE